MTGSELPDLVEANPDLLQWAFYGTTSMRVRVATFLSMAGFGWALVVLCIADGLIRGNLDSVAQLTLALVAIIWTCAWVFICFCSVVHQADAIARELRRSVYVLGKLLYTRAKPIRNGDTIVMCAVRDHESGGAGHRVYLERDGTYRLICYFRLKSEQPSKELIAMFDRIAELLSIQNGGYIPRRRLLWSWLTRFMFTDR